MKKTNSSRTPEKIRAWNQSDKGKAAQARWKLNGAKAADRRRRTIRIQESGTSTCPFVIAARQETRAKAKKSRKSWSVEDINLLRVLCNSSVADRDIAIALSRSINAIQHKKNRLGLTCSRQQP
ncbi:hypothetical protein K0P33_21270 [Pseudomonas sp. ArH3a]|uniref:hypothetical protein n=1 Tax=Pseudomonas sp. ArH3a TaxID=2862945 RepID=UPI001F57C155|nr:hypothetical protein [Pseudomonas sp. ArH3a]UNM18072.1 hypothetical protein K0P33_21270 [Pseudomonas sp. ArH3a]